jgi:hypothetical protein
MNPRVVRLARLSPAAEATAARETSARLAAEAAAAQAMAARASAEAAARSASDRESSASIALAAAAERAASTSAAVAAAKAESETAAAREARDARAARDAAVQQLTQMQARVLRSETLAARSQATVAELAEQLRTKEGAMTVTADATRRAAIVASAASASALLMGAAGARPADASTRAAHHQPQRQLAAQPQALAPPSFFYGTSLASSSTVSAASPFTSTAASSSVAALSSSLSSSSSSSSSLASSSDAAATVATLLGPRALATDAAVDARKRELLAMRAAAEAQLEVAIAEVLASSASAGGRLGVNGDGAEQPHQWGGESVRRNEKAGTSPLRPAALPASSPAPARSPLRPSTAGSSDSAPYAQITQRLGSPRATDASRHAAPADVVAPQLAAAAVPVAAVVGSADGPAGVGDRTLPPHSSAWPPSLRRHVVRVFEGVATHSQKDAVEVVLRSRIKDAWVSGTLWTTDWDAEELPRIMMD